MWLLSPFYRFLARFRYPNALPQEVASDLGVSLPEQKTVEELLSCLTKPSCCITKLEKYMPRAAAEKMFSSATKKECFNNNTLYSYYFNEGWVEFMLTFDDQRRLRRLYLQHRLLNDNCELKLLKK